MKRNAFIASTFFALIALAVMLVLLSVRAELHTLIRKRELVTAIKALDFRKAQDIVGRGSDGYGALPTGAEPTFGIAWQRVKTHMQHKTSVEEFGERISGLDLLIEASEKLGPPDSSEAEGFENLAIALHSAGATTFKRDSHGHTLLDIAVQRRMHKLVLQLVSSKPGIEQDAYRNLCIAEKDDALALLMNGTSANAKDIETGRTALFSADRRKTEVLLANGANISAAAYDGSTPLFCQCAAGNDEVATYLLNHGATVEDTTPATGISTVMMATAHCGLAIVKRVAALGGDISQKTRNGDTILMFAVTNPELAVTAWALTSVPGLEVNQRGTNGCTALDVVNQRLSKAQTEQERTHLLDVAAQLKSHGATATGASKPWTLDHYILPNRSMAPEKVQAPQ